MFPIWLSLSFFHKIPHYERLFSLNERIPSTRERMFHYMSDSRTDLSDFSIYERFPDKVERLFHFTDKFSVSVEELFLLWASFGRIKQFFVMWTSSVKAEPFFYKRT